jgi:FkbM family methyltransferase
MKKYAQYNEEEFLLDYFKGIDNGVLVDIGAADGITNSNSRYLIELGWSGLLVEPNKKNFEKLVELYSNNKNIILENVGCSEIHIDSAEFYIDQNDEYQQLSTFSLEQTDKCRRMYNCEFILEKINLIKTSDLLLKHSLNKIDFMSIDTESYDTNVIKGIDFSVCDINLICIEDDNMELNEILVNKGYKVVHKTANIFYSNK